MIRGIWRIRKTLVDLEDSEDFGAFGRFGVFQGFWKARRISELFEDVEGVQDF